MPFIQVEDIQHLTALTEFRMCSRGGLFVPYLTALSSLRHVDLIRTKLEFSFSPIVDFPTASCLTLLTQINTMTLHNIPFNTPMQGTLLRLTNLTHFSGDITSFSFVEQLTQLRKLTLTDLTAHHGLVQRVNLPTNLQSLHLYVTDKFRMPNVKMLKSLTRLKSTCPNSKLFNPKLTQLRSLYLNGDLLTNTMLRNLRNLQSLTLHSCRNVDYATLTEPQSVRKMGVQAWNADPKILKFSNLTMLRLSSFVNLDPNSFSHLTNLTAVEFNGPPVPFDLMKKVRPGIKVTCHQIY